MTSHGRVQSYVGVEKSNNKTFINVTAVSKSKQGFYITSMQNYLYIMTLSCYYQVVSM